MTLLETFFNIEVLGEAFPALLRGLINTFLLGIAGIGLGIPLGLLIGLIRLYAPKPFRYAAVFYIDILRATPMLVVLMIIYFALPFVGIRLSSWACAILAFTIVMAAYMAEVFRSGIESIPRGQFEAAAALGLSFITTLRKVVLPQAVRLVIPPTTNNCVSMFKDTSLASTVALAELMKEGLDAQTLYANPTPLIGAALIYIAFLWPMVRLVSMLEKKFSKEKKR
ncbi:amino acid ABC transporter permease [Neorhizobium sp. SOG26]|uniref:amino acid ABC transporter permease n=1 Tax=Neorhizobium sp. SOG26 TaxID=2060726 RepID=UPI000E585F0D|nr:amino acid ABC transporter permease [Neorhizobium sp. SOG26]AXV16776.1 amino acid ABC transporter permease [Neorhizobium sp. SOG26]